MDPSLTSVLYKTILAVCPITGMMIGDWNDKTTWLLTYDPAATNAQKAAATTAITNFDVVAQNNALVNAAAQRVASVASYSTDARYTNMISTLHNATATQIANFVNSNSTADAGTKDILIRLLLMVGTLV